MNKEIAHKWHKQALHDLQMAEKNISIEGYDIASFLSQQSVEKLLKSIYAIEGKRIPKSHYIDELAINLKISEEVVDYILDLTADYMFARYPDISDSVPYEQYNEEIATEKVEKAKNIFKALEHRYRDLGENSNE